MGGLTGGMTGTTLIPPGVETGAAGTGATVVAGPGAAVTGLPAIVACPGVGAGVAGAGVAGAGVAGAGVIVPATGCTGG